MMARSNPSSPSAFRPMPKKNLTARQSGHSDKGEGRRTPPASTSSLTPLARNSRNPSPPWPIRIQAWDTPATNSGSAAPFRASTKKGRLSARQAAMRRAGSSPAPATMPSLAAAIGLGLAQATDRFGAGEIEHVAHWSDVGELLRHLFEPLGESPDLVTEQHLVGRAQRLNLLAREAATLQPDDVETRQTRAIAPHRAIGDDVALDPGDAADHGMAADAHELVHRAQAAEHGVILDADMAGQGRVVGHDDVIADDAVMRHMRADHEQTPVAHLGHHAAAAGAGVHGHLFADDVVAADNQARILALVFQILRLMADGGEREDTPAFAHARPSGDDDMREQLDILAQLGLRTHDAIGTDLDRRGDAGSRLDDGRRMNLRHM